MSLVVPEAHTQFQHILRLLNTNVDGKRKIQYALTEIKGVGRRYANIVCKKADVDLKKRAGELNSDELERIVNIMQNPTQFKIPLWFLNRQKDIVDGKYSQLLSNAVDSKLREDLERLKKIQMPPAIPDKIPCDREDQLQREIEDLRICLDQEETEESWDKMQRALARFKAVVRGGGYRHESFVPTLKPLSRFISASMLSERGRLSAVAIELIATLVSALGKRFEPLVQGYMPTLLRLCQRPNKVVITRAHGCITTLIKQSRLSSIIPFLREAVKEKSVTLRVVASESANLCITTVEEDKLMSKITDIESIIKTTSRDPNPEVRKYARAITQEYRERFPDRYAMFISPLTPTTRKYLDIKTDNVILPKNPLPLKLNPSGPSSTSAAPKPPNPQVTTIKSSLSTGASTRNDQSAAIQKETIPFPPRPQSAASLRPRLVQMVPNEPSSNLRTGGARPVSVDLSDLPALTGNHGKSERPVSVL
ncbi:hypothetical protein FS842_001216, partial [Serendipita sp. 407]